MDIRDAIDLLGSAGPPSTRRGGTGRDSPQTWADLGCGEGTFTRALAAHLPAGSTIHAMDRDRAALRHLPAEEGAVSIHTHTGDFTQLPWPFADLDGILMANSLHYVKDQAAFIQRCAAALDTSGAFVIVEYDSDAANRWVPYPVSRTKLASLFARAGYPHLETLGSRPSLYGRARLYAARITR